MPDEGSAAGLEQLREELRRDIRNEVRNALRELEASRAAASSHVDGLGPLSSRCFIIIAVPVGCEEVKGVRRFSRLEDEASEASEQ